MSTKRSLLIAELCLFLCSGFWFGYKPDVQQGNIINTQQIAQLKLGMTKKAVKNLLGTSLVSEDKILDQDSEFSEQDDSEDMSVMQYIYFYQPARGPVINQKLYLIFEDEKLSKIESTF